MVECSVGLDDLFGVRSLALENGRATTGRLVLSLFAVQGLVESRYVRHVETSALELLDGPQDIARGLLGELFEALAQGDYPAGASPFPE